MNDMSDYIDVRTLKAGTRLELVDDSLVELTQNPEAGYWILGRYLTSPQEPWRVGKEEMILWSDIE